MKTYTPRFDLPGHMTRQIGRIIVRYAYLEHYARVIIYELLNLDAKRGRVAVREPDLTDRINMIADLALFNGVDVPETKITSLTKKTDDNKSLRDLYAHGLWTYDNGRWMVQVARGNNPRKPGTSKRAASRRARPAGLIVKPENLQFMVADLEDIIDELGGLHNWIKERLKSSPEKQRQ